MREEWRDVPGWEGLYAVSDHGRVYSYRYDRLLSGKASGYKKQYRSLRLTEHPHRQWFAGIHQMVALAFIGERPSSFDTRHLDGNPLNNRLSNLAYGTKAENAQDAIRHGKRKARRDSPQS